MLLLSNDEIASLFGIRDCIEALDVAYADFGRGQGVQTLRTDLYVRRRAADLPQFPELADPCFYRMGYMAGAAPAFGTSALRVTSFLLHWSEAAGRRINYPATAGGSIVGLVILFDLDGLVPLAMFPDTILTNMRVAATNGLGAKYLARDDATVLAILGAGAQARMLTRAMAAVRELSEVRVFGPSEDNRTRFAAELERELNIPVRPVASAEEAMAGAHIVGSATNSSVPVFTADRLEPGMHVGITRPEEINDPILSRFDILATNGADESFEQAENPTAFVFGEYEGSGHSRFTEGWWKDTTLLSRMAQLGSDVITGRVRRQTRQEMTFFSSTGRGLQWAAMGGRLYQIAVERGVGQQVAADWFGPLAGSAAVGATA